jgi:hypothetical protein
MPRLQVPVRSRLGKVQSKTWSDIHTCLWRLQSPSSRRRTRFAIGKRIFFVELGRAIESLIAAKLEQAQRPGIEVAFLKSYGRVFRLVDARAMGGWFVIVRRV